MSTYSPVNSMIYPIFTVIVRYIYIHTYITIISYYLPLSHNFPCFKHHSREQKRIVDHWIPLYPIKSQSHKNPIQSVYSIGQIHAGLHLVRHLDITLGVRPNGWGLHVPGWVAGRKKTCIDGEYMDVKKWEVITQIVFIDLLFSQCCYRFISLV